MWLSQYAPKGVKSLCITSSQTVYVRKPDLVSSKTLQRLGCQLICKIYLNTYFQRARLGGRLICKLGLYASIYVHGLHRSVLSYQWCICFIALCSHGVQNIITQYMGFSTSNLPLISHQCLLKDSGFYKYHIWGEFVQGV